MRPLIREEDIVQKLVYYINKSLVGAELNYLPLEKLVFALVIAFGKLRHYFDAHPIKILTSHLIRATLQKFDLAGRMEKWYVELNRFHIDYEPRTSIKGHVLAEFIAEFQDDKVEGPSIPTPPIGGQEPTTSSSEIEIEKQME